jgi:hypothetical protein
MSELPNRWWQWLLMYPTMAIALVGAVPQYSQWVTAFRIGVPPAAVNDAQEQLQAWERNIACQRDRDIQSVKPTSKTNYGIELTTCPSGDILLTLTPIQNPDNPVSKWIVTKNYFTQLVRFSIIASAMAEDNRMQAAPPSTVRVIDTMKGGTTVTRRVQRSDNTCVDQTIDAYTGRLLDQKTAPCTQF